MKQTAIEKGWSHEPGIFVSIRPCGDEYEKKTFLGIYVGDVAIGQTYDLPPLTRIHNPCIWVPDLQEYIFGCESWWGEIESEEQLHQITDADIENVWYVRALKALQK